MTMPDWIAKLSPAERAKVYAQAETVVAAEKRRLERESRESRSNVPTITGRKYNNWGW